MAKNKTTENENSVADYLAKITDEKRRNDCSYIIDLFTEYSGFEAKMWGTINMPVDILAKHHW